MKKRGRPGPLSDEQKEASRLERKRQDSNRHKDKWDERRASMTAAEVVAEKRERAERTKAQRQKNKQNEE